MKTYKTLLIYVTMLCLPMLVMGTNTAEDSYVWVTVKNVSTEKPVEGVSVTVNENFVGVTGPLGRIRIPSVSTSTSIGFYHTSFAPKVYPYRLLARNNFVVLLEESVLNIQEVVIKANRVEQNFQKTAQEIRTISAKSMSNQFQANTADALGLDPNIFIQKSQGGGGSPMIRGMSTSRVLLLVDGIRMNNAIFRSGNVHNVISIDAESISDLEISLGPGSVLHGSDAMGGVMHINTYDAHYGDSSEVLQSLVFSFASQTAQLTRRPNFRMNYGGTHWAGMTSITYSQYSDIRMGKRVLSGTPEEDVNNMLFVCRPLSFGTLDTLVKAENPYLQENTGYEQRNFTQKFKFRVSERSEIKIGQYASLSSTINRYDRIIQTKNGLPKYSVWEYGPQFWLMSFASFENRSITKLSDWYKITLSGQLYGESRNVRKYNNVIGRIQTERVNIGQLSFDASKKISKSAQLTYGAEALTNTVGSSALYYNQLNLEDTWSAQSRYADGSIWNSASVFANTNIDLTPALALNSGARLNAISMFTPIRFNGLQEDALFNFIAPSGSIGLTYYKPTFKYFLSLSSGFRAPNVDDASKVFDSQPGALVVPNSNLREERLYSAEVGMKQRLNSWIAFDGSFYYSFLDNALLRAPFQFDGNDSVQYDGTYSQVLAIQNLDFAWIWGYQFGLRTQINKHFSWTAHLSHPFGRDSQGQNLRHVHPLNATSQLVFKKKKWSANIVGRYNAKVSAEDLAPSEQSKTHIYAIDSEGNPYSPQWYTCNVHASYIFNKNMVLRLGINNITDVQYRPYSSGIAAPGRSFFIGLRGSI